MLSALNKNNHNYQNSNRNTSLSFENGPRSKRNSNIMNLGGVLTPNNYIANTEGNPNKINKYIQKHTHQTIDVDR